MCLELSIQQDKLWQMYFEVHRKIYQEIIQFLNSEEVTKNFCFEVLHDLKILEAAEPACLLPQKLFQQWSFFMFVNIGFWILFRLTPFGNFSLFHDLLYQLLSNYLLVSNIFGLAISVPSSRSICGHSRRAPLSKKKFTIPFNLNLQ